MGKEDLLFQLQQLSAEGKKVDPMLADTWKQIQEQKEAEADDLRRKEVGKLFTKNTHP